jgi:hypothetical protein
MRPVGGKGALRAMADLDEGEHMARSTVGGSPFPPKTDYGFLSDCEVSALVAPGGNVEWMCRPRIHEDEQRCEGAIAPSALDPVSPGAAAVPGEPPAPRP